MLTHQANASSKRIAQSNSTALKNLQLGLIVVLVSIWLRAGQYLPWVYAE